MASETVIITLLILIYLTLLSFIVFYCYSLRKNKMHQKRIRSIQAGPLPKLLGTNLEMTNVHDQIVETKIQPFYNVLEGDGQCGQSSCRGACNCSKGKDQVLK